MTGNKSRKSRPGRPNDLANADVQAGSGHTLAKASQRRQEHRGLDIGTRAVLGAPWHDEELAWPEDHVAVTHLDGELTAKDQEEFVGVVVLVPGELSLELHDPDVVVIDLGDLLRWPWSASPAIAGAWL